MPPPNLSLWLLRHAKAITDPPAGGADFDRKLAPRGRRDAKALGHLIGRHGKHLGMGHLDLPQIALVSPAARTAATAELVLEIMDAPPTTEMVPELYGADPEEVLAHLRAMRDAVTSVMVVGHNPTVHALAVQLIGPDDQDGRDLVVRRGFPTCALGIYNFDITRWSDVGGLTAHLAGLFTPPFDQP